jgi:hypothetical protein
MKITILDTIPGEEDEIIIKCQNLSEDIQNLLQKLKQGNTKIAGHNENGIHLLSRMKFTILRRSTTKCLPAAKKRFTKCGRNCIHLRACFRSNRLCGRQSLRF